MFSIFLCQNHAIYEISFKSVVDPDIPQMTLRRMCFACWINKATAANSEYVILIAFPRKNGYADASQSNVYKCIAWLFILVVMLVIQMF